MQFTASAELHDKLERLTALMRSEVPDGDLAAVIERAVSETLERLEARRFAQTTAPRKGLGETDTSPTSRHIPAAVRRAVRERDGDRCGYVDEQGDAAPRGTGSSSTTVTPSAWEGTTVPGTSACCARPTTATWPSTTTAPRVRPAVAAASARQ